MNNDIRAALLGDKEAAKRLTDAGCCCRVRGAEQFPKSKPMIDL